MRSTAGCGGIKVGRGGKKRLKNIVTLPFLFIYFLLFLSRFWRIRLKLENVNIKGEDKPVRKGVIGGNLFFKMNLRIKK